MAATSLRIYLDNNPAEEQQEGLFTQIKVDQAIGMATEAELQIDISSDRTGRWAVMEDEFVQLFNRIRIEVKVRDSQFMSLIDGPIVGTRFELSASPNRSKIILVVQDDSVLLNQEEEVEIYEDMAPHEIAQQLFQRYGLNPDTDSVTTQTGGLSRFLVRRGTAMQFLRELARRHGMFVYVQPDDSPGSSKGLFKRPDLTPTDYPDLQLMGAGHNIREFTGYLDGLRPLKARAYNVDITNQDMLTSETDVSDLEAQGEEAVHNLLEAGCTILARTREEAVDLDAATLAAVNHSSWAYSANAEVVADNYPGILSPYRAIVVRGVGGHLSGSWLISRVTHSLNGHSYKQAFTLRRNARSAGVQGGGTSSGGIF